MFNWIIANWKDVTLIVAGMVSVASIIVKLTPTPKDDAVLAKIVKVLEILALNKKEDAKN